jgi:hypothetical protein
MRCSVCRQHPVAISQDEEGDPKLPLDWKVVHLGMRGECKPETRYFCGRCRPRPVNPSSVATVPPEQRFYNDGRWFLTEQQARTFWHARWPRVESWWNESLREGEHPLPWPDVYRREKVPGHRCAQRIPYWTARSLAAALRELPAVCCSYCGRRINRLRPRMTERMIPDWIIDPKPRLPDDLIRYCDYRDTYKDRIGIVIYWDREALQNPICSFRCFRKTRKRLVKYGRFRNVFEEKLQCLNQQMIALRKWCQTKNHDHFHSLSEGYGPAKISPI